MIWDGLTPLYVTKSITIIMNILEGIKDVYSSIMKYLCIFLICQQHITFHARFLFVMIWDGLTPSCVTKSITIIMNIPESVKEVYSGIIKYLSLLFLFVNKTLLFTLGFFFEMTWDGLTPLYVTKSITIFMKVPFRNDLGWFDPLMCNQIDHHYYEYP